MTGKRKRSFHIHVDGLALIEKRMGEKGYDRQQLAEKADLSVETVNRLLRGEPRQKATIQAIAKVLNVGPTELVDAAEWYLAQRKPRLPNAAIAKVDIDALVHDVREKAKAIIHKDCGEMKVLDMTQPIGLDDIYATVNILERPTRLRGTKIAEQLLNYDPDSDNHGRHGLGRVISVKPISGLKAIHNHTKLMVLGKPGAGKTTFLKHLAIQCIKEGQELSDHVPIFITLKRFAEEKGQPELTLYISHIFDACGVSADDISLLIQHGRAFILLDGLDEVREEDSVRVINQVQSLANRHRNNHFIITCRIAAYEYSFQGFIDVEIADFNDQQIKTFVTKWFQAKEEPALSDRFMHQLEVNSSVKELATSPLLLTLLCLEFEDSGDLPSDRVSLYDRAIDTLLRRWDKKRGIERDEIYKNLTLTRKEDLLSHVAFTTFECKDYFFKQRDVEQRISDFIRDLRDAQTDPEALILNSRLILKSIEAQHGLLVERARGVYSFSHLTFHEYFAARRISKISHPLTLESALCSLAVHITEPRWREVFLLIFEMMADATELLKLIKQEVDSVLSQDAELQEFLQWANQKASIKVFPYKKLATRAFYFELDLFFNTELISSLDFVLAGLADENFYNALDWKQEHLQLDNQLRFDEWLTSAVYYSYREGHGQVKDCIECFYEALEFCSDFAPDLEEKLEALEAEVPDFDGVVNDEQDWWKRVQLWWNARDGAEWRESLQEIATKFFGIGYERNFSDEQQDLLYDYYYANRLVLECLHTDCHLNYEVRQQVEDSLFLTIAEIESRKSRYS